MLKVVCSIRTFEEAYEGTAQEVNRQMGKKILKIKIRGIATALFAIVVTFLVFGLSLNVYVKIFVFLVALMVLIKDMQMIVEKYKAIKGKDFMAKIIPALYEVSKEKISVNEINDSNLLRLKPGSAVVYHGTLNVDVDYHKFKIHDLTIVTNAKGANGKAVLIHEGGLFISTPDEFPCRVKIEPDMKRELEEIVFGIEATELQKELINMNVVLTSKMKNIMVELKPMQVEGDFRVYADDATVAARLVDEKYLKRLAGFKDKVSVYWGHDKFYALIHDVHLYDERETIRNAYDKVYCVVKKLSALLPFD